MKYFRIIIINLFVLLCLFFFLGIAAYFIGVNRIHNFFELTGEDHKHYLKKDSLAMFVHLPEIKIYDNWGTPQQKLTTERRTNNLGFREDDNITEKKDNEYRILITGDSHTDGVLKKNAQSFVNIWEYELNKKDTTTYYNCINGGTAYYTFRNYAGFLKKYLYLKPDVFLINIFVGNDFRETVMFEDNRNNVSNVFKNIFVRTRRTFYSKEKKSIPFTQGVEQLLYYELFPSEKEKSLQIAKKYMLEIKALCKKNNIKLIVTLLPSKIDSKENFKSKIKTLFTLNHKDINANEHLKKKFSNWLNSQGIANYDLIPPLKAETEKVYWDEDLHINPKGHQVIADFLFKSIVFK